MRYIELTCRCAFEPEAEEKIIKLARKMYTARPLATDLNGKPIPASEFIEDVEEAIIELAFMTFTDAGEKLFEVIDQTATRVLSNGTKLVDAETGKLVQ